jgi:hypothetical protein
LTAVFASVTGVLAAINSALKPGDRADRYKRAGDRWVTLRDKAKELYKLESQLPDATATQLKAEYLELLKQKEANTLESPLLPNWAWRASGRGA